MQELRLNSQMKVLIAFWHRRNCWDSLFEVCDNLLHWDFIVSGMLRSDDMIFCFFPPFFFLILTLPNAIRSRAPYTFPSLSFSIDVSDLFFLLSSPAPPRGTLASARLLTGDAKERERHTHTHILLLLLLNAVCVPLGASTDRIVTCVNFVISARSSSINFC